MIPLDDCQVEGCAGRYEDNGDGFCRCCTMWEDACRCDESTRDPNLPLASPVPETGPENGGKP